MPRANFLDNFQTICRAVRNQEAALLLCTNTENGEQIAVICAANRLRNGQLEFVPLARMLEDPMAEVMVPSSLLPPEVNPELN